MSWTVMPKLEIRLTDFELAQLKAEAAAEGVPLSNLVRYALGLPMAKVGRPRKLAEGVASESRSSRAKGSGFGPDAPSARPEWREVPPIESLDRKNVVVTDEGHLEVRQTYRCSQGHEPKLSPAAKCWCGRTTSVPV